jgi:hypothetical protein
VIAGRLSAASARRQARLCGVLYLYIIAAGTFAEVVVRGTLVVPTDAEATARNVLANEGLLRLAFSGEFLHLAFDVVVAALLYALLRPVDRTVALVAALMRLACDVVLAAAGVTQLAALRLLHGGEPFAALPPGQRHALALLALRLHGDGYAISLVFFAFACLALGWLVLRSRYLPRALGALLAVAGVCYLATSFAHLLALGIAGSLQALFLPIFVAELSLALWLLAKGVNAAKWQER